jgi:RNA polymerase sigma-70 factor (ECF subfamily)
MNHPGDPLLLSLAAGQAQAFGLLYDRFAGRLFGAAMGMLGRREDAEDVVQEVFMAMVRSRHQLSRVDNLTAYLFTALRHAAAKHASRRARQPVTSEAAEEAVATEAEQDHPRGEELRTALAGLPPEQREVIAMKIDGEWTFAQIGQVLGVSPNTAASRYRYALEKLRVTLQKTSKRHGSESDGRIT